VCIGRIDQLSIRLVTVLDYRDSALLGLSLDDLSSVHNYKNERELRFRALLTEEGSEGELELV
jgi:hypothetical protein